MGTTELLTYGLIIAGFLAFNFFMQWAARRARASQMEEQAQPQEAPVSPADEPLEVVLARQPEPATSETPAATTMRPRARRIVRTSLFRSRDDLRHAIVVMTVLGPCRALEPYDLNQAGPADSRVGTGPR